MSKKRREISSRNLKKSARYKGTPGTVLSLRPSEPILCKTSTTALEASRLMSAKRENCILVVDDRKRLVGIFTAKDLAFRVVASGKVAAFVTVDEIMTKNPMCVANDTQASEALNLMVQRGFRHLPILDSEGQVTGVLDITKCYQEAMEKLERMYESSKKLYDALDNVNHEIGLAQQPFQVVKYFENLQELMGGPTLDTVLDDETTLPVYINVKSSVYDAAVMMKDNRTTAILVKDSNNEEVSGIFTSKDVVLRVIAAGLDPKTCSVVRVMTPQPDCASKDLTIHEALRQMFNGHYLNLPVVEDSEIIGIVEVLKLTYATLNQLKAVKSGDDNDNPIWNRFWTALDDSDSVHSDSFSHPGSGTNPTQYSSASHPHNELVPLSSEIRPNDSISCANEPASYDDAGSSVVGMEHEHENVRSHFSEVNIKETAFSFKFKSPLGRVHRITLKPKDGIDTLKSLIAQKLHDSELKLLTASNGALDDDSDDDSEVAFLTAGSKSEFSGSSPKFAISYKDDEGDLVAITTNQDLTDCATISKKLRLTKADLFVHHPQASLETILGDPKSRKAQPQQPIIYSQPVEKELIPGVPNQLILPGAILTLAASILVVFTFSRR